MKEKRDLSFLTGVCALAIALVLFIVRLAGGPALSTVARIALTLSFVAVVAFGLALIFDEMDERMPMLPAYPCKYRRLKAKTVRQLRKLKGEGKLTQNEIQKKKGAFLVHARKCGISPAQAKDDFELEIRRRVL